MNADFRERQQALTIRKLAVRYSNSSQWVLQDFDLAVRSGEFVVIIGPSGCGKSTLLRLIAGFTQLQQGEIVIGKRVAATAGGVCIPPEERDVGFVFQSYALWPHMTVKANITFPLEQKRFTALQREQRVDEAIMKFGLQEHQHRYPAELSGGQRQRVALARALVGQPALLLMDEPLSSLDVALRKRIQDELLIMHKEWQPAVLYVTHDQDEAVKLADRLIVLNEGKIQQAGTPYDIFHSPNNSFVANFFGEVNELVGSVVENQGNGLSCIRIGDHIFILARTQSSLTSGERVRVFIRPSWVDIQEREDMSNARITDSRFMGAYTDYSLEWQGIPLRVSTQNTISKRVGDSIFLKVKDAWSIKTSE